MPTLAEKLGSLRDKYAAMLKPQMTEIMDRHIDELRSSGAVGRALKAGDRAPAFALEDQHGTTVSSSDLLAAGPLVVTFYRGTWCPYCNAELTALTEAYDRIRAAGGQLIAVTPQSSAAAASYLADHPAPFPILVDTDAKVAEAFELAYAFPDDLRDLYENVFKNDLAVVNDGHSWRLPIPGRFVVDRDGTIVDAQVDADYRYRPDPNDTIAVLERLHATT